MNKQIEVGDTFIVEMLPNKKKRNLPICRCDGRIGFISSKTKEHPSVGETWLVSAIDVQSTFIIVEPCFLEMSKEVTKKHKSELLSKLVSTKPQKTKKIKKTFPYLSKNEI